MIRSTILLALLFIVIAGCKEVNEDDEKAGSEATNHPITKEENPDKNLASQKTDSDQDTVEVPAEFSRNGFDQALKYELLLETHICNPNFTDTVTDGTVPCSAKYFRFFSYNHKRSLENAFMLQVKAGVNNYPYRRLLIFTRERGKLVLVNGVTGYLVSKVKRPNQIDDLIVAVIDDLGNSILDRYDVLLRYKDGKYHIVEAIGDLQGKFESDELKERATRDIKKRIKEKELIF